MTNFDINWDSVQTDLNTQGYALVPDVLSAEECEAIKDLYDQRALFYTKVNMRNWKQPAKGEYKYFEDRGADNPEIVQTVHDLNAAFYTGLSDLANAWNYEIGENITYPPEFDRFQRMCATKGQTKPSPLLLKYEDGGHNDMHRDLYGKITFPFQMAVMLSQHGKDFTNGRFLLGEEKNPQPINPNKGDAVIFPTSHRVTSTDNGLKLSETFHGVERIERTPQNDDKYVRATLGLIPHGRKAPKPR